FHGAVVLWSQGANWASTISTGCCNALRCRTDFEAFPTEPPPAPCAGDKPFSCRAWGQANAPRWCVDLVPARPADAGCRPRACPPFRRPMARRVGPGERGFDEQARGGLGGLAALQVFAVFLRVFAMLAFGGLGGLMAVSTR